MQDPEKLAVWRRSQVFSARIDDLLEHWSARRSGTLKGQMHRSASSIPDNIAEGCGMQTNREFAPYLKHAIGSTREHQGQLHRALIRRLITPALHQELRAEIIEIRKMTYGLLKRVQGE